MARAEAATDGATLLAIDVVYCPAAGAADEVTLRLPATASLADALRESGLIERHGLDPGSLAAGIWGRIKPPDTPLRDRDQVEIYRPLTVDPKEARRLRQQQQRGAGGRKRGGGSAAA